MCVRWSCFCSLGDYNSVTCSTTLHFINEANSCTVFFFLFLFPFLSFSLRLHSLIRPNLLLSLFDQGSAYRLNGAENCIHNTHNNLCIFYTSIDILRIWRIEKSLCLPKRNLSRTPLTIWRVSLVRVPLTAREQQPASSDLFLQVGFSSSLS